MQKAKLITAILTGPVSIGTIGAEVLIMAEAELDGFMTMLTGATKMYAGALPKADYTEEEIQALEDIFDDESSDFYPRKDEYLAAAPEGYFLTVVSDTEIELID